MTLILLAHGSRHPRAAAGLEQLRARVAFITGADTTLAYLDLQTPLLSQVAQPGDTVVPLLFTDAFHSNVDVPAAASGLGVHVTAPLGLGEDIAQLLAGEVRYPRVILYAVGSSVPGANEAVIALADRVSELSGASVTTAFATCAPRLEEGRDAQILPLFVTHGLLLDQLRGLDYEVPEPLTELLASVVVDRFST